MKADVRQLQRNQRWHGALQGLTSNLGKAEQSLVEGKLKRVVGTTLEAEGCSVPIGGYCRVATAEGGWLETEVVGFAGERTLLMPTGELRGVMPNARVVPTPGGGELLVSDQY